MFAAALSLGVPQTANAPGVRLNRWRLEAPVAAMAFTRDAAHAAFALHDGTVRLVPLRQFDARKMAAAVLHQGAARALCADCADNSLLSAGADGRVVSVDADGFAAELIERPCGALGAIAAVTSPEGARWRAVADGGAVELFDARAGRRRFDPGVGAVTGLAFRPDGRRLAVSGDEGLAVFSLDGGAPAPLLPKPAGPTRRPTRRPLWSPRGDRLAAIGGADRVACWTLGDGGPRGEPATLGKARDVAWAARGRYLVGAGARGLVAWPIVAAGPVAVGATRPCAGSRWGRPSLLGLTGGRAVTAITGHPTHELAAAGYDDGCIILADLGHRREMMIKHADLGAVTALAWSPAGDFLAAASDDEALLFDFTTLTRRAPR